MIDSDLQHKSSVWYRYPIGHLSISQDSQHQVLISQHFHENQFQQLQTFFNIVFIFFNNYWELTHDSKLVNPFLRRLHSKYSKISEKKNIFCRFYTPKTKERSKKNNTVFYLKTSLDNSLQYFNQKNEQRRKYFQFLNSLINTCILQNLGAVQTKEYTPTLPPYSDKGQHWIV